MVDKQPIKNKRKVSWFWTSLIAFTLLFILPTVTLLNLASDSYALVEEAATINSDSATKAKNVAKEVYANLTSTESGKHFSLKLTEDDINGIAALAMRGFKNLEGRVNITPVGIKSAFSLAVPQNPFGAYINVSVTLIPSASGFYVDNISIGDLTISGELSLSLIEKLLNLFLAGDTIGTKLLTSIESIQVNNSKLTVAYHSIPDLKQAIQLTKGKVRNIRNDLMLLANPDDVKAYYLNICKLHSKIGDLGSVPLGYYLSDTFAFAAQRTSNGKQAQEENKAAILALSIFLGSAQFDSFIGAIDEKTFESCQPEKTNVVIANRNDLRLHFIFSATLKIISDSSISFAIGEFKELLDSGEGGTGFSFTDLAADRSGIRFSELALSESGALTLQRMASGLTQEKIYFPALTDLPDGISQQDFKKKGGLDGAFYKKHLALINRRIDDLPLYKVF